MKTKTSPPAKAKKLATTQPLAKLQSKQSQLIDLLKKKTGTTIEEMMVLTGWQAHTVRGIISGALKKRLGLNVVSIAGASGTRTYRITEVKTS